MTEPVFDPNYPPVTVLKHANRKTLRAFARLNFTVAASLPENKKHYLRQRTLPDLTRHFMAGHMGVVGMSGHRIVGELLLTKADGHALRNLQDYPFDSENAPKVLVIQGVCVEPGFSRHGLAGRMLDTACEEAAVQGRAVVLGKTAATNKRGLKVFKDAGFEQIGESSFYGTDSYRSVFMAKAVGAVAVQDVLTIPAPRLWMPEKRALRA